MSGATKFILIHLKVVGFFVADLLFCCYASENREFT